MIANQVATEVSVYRTTSDGVTKSGSSYRPNGLYEAALDRKARLKLTTKNPHRNTGENIPLRWETALEIQLEFDHSLFWDAVIESMAPEAGAGAADTPGAGLTTTTRYIRRDDDAQLWGATVTLGDGQCYRLDGMTVARVMVSVGGRRPSRATVRFGVLNLTPIESGSKDVPDVVHAHMSVPSSAVTPYLVVGDGASWSTPRSDDAATVHTASWDFRRERLASAAFDASGVPQRWEFAGGFAVTGRASMTVPVAAAKLLHSSVVDARLGFGFDTGRSTESLFFDFPQILATATAMRPVGEGFAITSADWVATGAGVGETAQVTVVTPS